MKRYTMEQKEGWTLYRNQGGAEIGAAVPALHRRGCPGNLPGRRGSPGDFPKPQLPGQYLRSRLRPDLQKSITICRGCFT